MKQWIKSGIGLLVAVLLAGCSEHSVNVENEWEPIDENSVVYMNVKLKLPTAPGTRSVTHDDGGTESGTETGQDYENKITSLLLVLAKRDYTYIAHGMAGALSVKDDGKVAVTAAITQTLLANYYTKDRNETNYSKPLPEGDEKILLFAYCNPPKDLTDVFDKRNENDPKGWLNAACQVIGKNYSTGDDVVGSTDGSNRSIWAKESFLMSNAELVEVEIPTTFDEWLLNYSEVDKPLSFGKDISVERSVARFDFKDGSPASTAANTYVVDRVSGMQGGSLRVQLVRMSLVNMSKKFYYLRRVSANANGYGDAVICGGETSQNHVVDVDAQEEHKNSNIEGKTPGDLKLKDYFNFCMFNEDGSIDAHSRYAWNNWDINTVLNADGDVLGDGGNWNDAGNSDKSGYHIWRYVTENTISNDNYQTAAVSTGVVFKGKLLVDENDETVNEVLRKAVNGKYTVPEDLKGKVYVYSVNGVDYPILYQFEGNLFVGWNNQVKKFAEDRVGSTIYSAVHDRPEGMDKTADELYQELVEINNSNVAQTTKDEALNKFRKAATAMGFTLYQASNDSEDYDPTQQKEEGYGVGYFFYYYYWNRHNNNGRNGVMGPMEFAVVRNNIYKLSVTGIHSLGHPRISDNDPENPTPDTPDEVGKVYFTVDVQVLPWTVRVNDIVF